jgi:hypothetical protein
VGGVCQAPSSEDIARQPALQLKQVDQPASVPRVHRIPAPSQTPMRRFQLLALLSIQLLASCASHRAPVSEAQIRQLLPGTWDQRPGIVQGRKTYYPDGTAEGIIMWPATRAGLCGPLVCGPSVNYRSRWRVRGDVLECFDIRAQPKVFSREQVLRDRVLRITPTRFEFEDLSTGRVWVDRRATVP